MPMAKAFFAMENQEDHPEGVKRSDEDPREHGEISEPGAGLAVMRGFAHGFDDRILGIETRKKRSPDQRQGSDQ